MQSFDDDDKQNLKGHTIDPQTLRLTDWEKEPTVEDLREDLMMAKPLHEEMEANLDRWEKNLRAQNASQNPSGGTEKRSKIQPKLIRKHAEWRYPTLTEPFLSNNRVFDVQPVTWEDVEAAKQNALVLNYQFETKMNKVALIDRYARSLVDKGSAILRATWIYEDRKVKKKEPVYKYAFDDSFMEQLNELLILKQENPNEFSRLSPELKESVFASEENNRPVVATIVGEQEVEVIEVVKNHPQVDVCNLRSVYIDPTCEGDIEKANFIIYAYETSLSDLKRSGRKYRNLEKIHVESANALSQPDEAFGSIKNSPTNFKDNPRKKITAYEYWGYRDIDGSGITVPILATWVENVCIEMVENPMPDKKLPFVLVPYLPVDEEIYGEPDGELLEDNQLIIGAVSRGMIDLMAKSANSQTGFAKGMFDNTNRTRFLEGHDYEYNPNFDPKIHMNMHKYPEVPNSALGMINLMTVDAESLTGIKSFGSGGLTANALGSASASSAAVRGVLDAATKREMSILRRMVAGLIAVGKKIISMNAVFLQDQEVIRVTNNNFVAISRDSLAGEFDLAITISTPEADEAKAAEMSFVLQTVGNNLPFNFSQMILSEIAALRKMPHLEHAIKNYKPEPDPLAERERMAEIALKEAQAALFQAQAMEARTKAQVNGAKVPVEQARAENLQAKADADRIRMANEDSGITHQRELEKAEQQAQKDAELQYLKGLQQQDQLAMQHDSQLLQQQAMNELSPPKASTNS